MRAGAWSASLRMRMLKVMHGSLSSVLHRYHSSGLWSVKPRSRISSSESALHLMRSFTPNLLSLTSVADVAPKSNSSSMSSMSAPAMFESIARVAYGATSPLRLTP